ncbi:PadR family transcriptional regulator [Alicyclobacillus dauci]|uniref:PadR family transcriptional regulator n=1 Tax=Alicyclobacillus dauci TaxID=1475485 RepID=A0ABY6Z3Y3_9BACL|nr:PadR family transcriptional regulator [Alicyclobacillus dauci]WAH37594.1 PadR family transcriptional regulator [Alicyclobacillus dauci]
MNSLAYALLSMLVRKPCSGYELKHLLEVFWQAKHSQIYPLLTKLQQDSLLTYELVEQSGKPNKKIYSITDKGLAVLQEWISCKSALPVIRDEFLIKVYAIWLVDTQSAKRMFEERISLFRKQVNYRLNEIRGMEEEHRNGIPDISSRSFGRYILFQRKLRQEQEEIEWCEWVLALLEENQDSRLEEVKRNT